MLAACLPLCERVICDGLGTGDTRSFTSRLKKMWPKVARVEDFELAVRQALEAVGQANVLKDDWTASNLRTALHFLKVHIEGHQLAFLNRYKPKPVHLHLDELTSDQYLSDPDVYKVEIQRMQMCLRRSPTPLGEWLLSLHAFGILFFQFTTINSAPDGTLMFLLQGLSQEECTGIIDAIELARQITMMSNLPLPVELVRDVHAICNCFEGNT
jgi:hypothetical protein